MYREAGYIGLSLFSWLGHHHSFRTNVIKIRGQNKTREKDILYLAEKALLMPNNTIYLRNYYSETKAKWDSENNRFADIVITDETDKITLINHIMLLLKEYKLSTLNHNLGNAEKEVMEFMVKMREDKEYNDFVNYLEDKEGATDYSQGIADESLKDALIELKDAYQSKDGNAILSASENVVLLRESISEIRVRYTGLKNANSIKDTEIDEILNKQDAEIDKKDLIDKMIKFHRNQNFMPLGIRGEHYMSVIRTVLGVSLNAKQDDFYNYLRGDTNATDYSAYITDTDQKEALSEFRDAYIGLVQAHKESSEQLGKIACVTIVASTALISSVATMSYVLNNNPIYSMKDRCKSTLCATRRSPHKETIIIAIASTVASVAAGNYVAAMM
ncbi:MAG: hypothetical protein ACK5WS_05125 [Alphaproteobacteria bacterium]|jgi:hypothetical protein|nr:hypothetical protein [Candidatus Jidaibacter sp.]